MHKINALMTDDICDTCCNVLIFLKLITLALLFQLSHTRSLLSQKPSKIMPIETSAITDSLSTNKVKPCIALGG